MTRRDALALAVLASTATGLPAAAHAFFRSRMTIYDGRQALARDWSRQFPAAFDCRVDPASLWFDSLRARLSDTVELVGMTCAADRLVLADLAGREGFRLSHVATVPLDPSLQYWAVRRGPPR